MRLLAAEHPFVDGNKRTALATVATFYAMNGSAFAYDHRVRTIPKRFATDESSVETEAVVEYCRENTRIEPGDRSNSESVVWREKSV